MILRTGRCPDLTPTFFDAGTGWTVGAPVAGSSLDDNDREVRT